MGTDERDGEEMMCEECIRDTIDAMESKPTYCRSEFEDGYIAALHRVIDSDGW